MGNALEATYPRNSGFGNNYPTDRGLKDIATIPASNLNLNTGRNGHNRANTMMENYAPVGQHNTLVHRQDSTNSLGL